MSETKIVYMCGVDWQWELGETTCKTYSSLASLQRETNCTDQCGAVRCEVKLLDWEIPQNFSRTLDENDQSFRETQCKLIEMVIERKKKDIERLEFQREFLTRISL